MRRRRLLLPLAAAAIFVVSSPSRAARTAELDEKGKLHSVDAGATLIGFDDSRRLAELGASLTKWRGNPWEAQLVLTPIVDDALFTGRAIAESEAIEGAGALRLGGSVSDGQTGVYIPGAAVIARLGGKTRFSATLWVRAEGALPYLVAAYGKDDGFVRVHALRTGRETSDGWAEISFGTVDIAVWGFPLHALHIFISPWDGASSATIIDALEIVPHAGGGVAPVACTQADIESTCGPDGDCQFGHCVPSYASWGPLPPRTHREAMVARWLHLATHVQGDRNAAENAKTLAAEGPSLATYAIGSRQFHGGLHRLINALRDQHTSHGYPYGSFHFPLSYGGGSSTLGACFGPGRHDLIADAGSPGKIGFIVFRANPYPLTPVALKRGDALTAIDGREPLEWMHEMWAAYAGSVSNDEASDLGWSASGMSSLIARRARSIEITRCDSDIRCDGAHRRVLTIDVASMAYARVLANGNVDPLINYFGCDIRFQHALDKFAPDVNGENKVSGQIVRGDVLAVEFDGTYGGSKWSPSMEALFPKDAVPTKVLFDTRQGNGGYAFNAETVVSLIRSSIEPVGNLLLPRGAWDTPDLTALIKASRICYDAPGGSYACLFSDVYFNEASKAVASGSRVVFLNTANVSANDFLARLVKGRSHQKIMAPNPTSGAYGSIAGTPPMAIGWGGGSMQMQDTLFAPSFAAMSSTTKFESGSGVQPDMVVAETMSDAIRDRDTMVEAAHAWLAGGGE